MRGGRFIVTSGRKIDGYAVQKEFGLVSASVVHSKSLFEDILAAFGGIFGGETHSYTQLLEETTEKAVHRMTLAAKVRKVLNFKAPLIFISNRVQQQ